MNDERKPPAVMPSQSTEPWTIRCRPWLRGSMAEEAKRRGLDEAEYARDCLAMGHRVFTALRDGEAYIRVPA